MSSVSGISTNYIQSLSTTSSWLLDAASATANSGDWLSPSSSSSSDPVIAAANAFAQVAQIRSSNESSFAVNQGIQTLQAQLSADALGGTGQLVNIFA